MRYLIIILLLAGCSTHNLKLASTGLLIADWQQTRTIAEDPRRTEKNPILGHHPSKSRVDAYFLACGLLNYNADKVLPEKWAKPYYYGVILLEAVVIRRNISLGINF